MNLKYNFGILKDKKVCFEVENNPENILYFDGIVDSFKAKKSLYVCKFKDGRRVEIKNIHLTKCIIRRNDDCIHFKYSSDPKFVSGAVGFAMSDTYGFPMEITKEILEEDGYELDVEGYKVLQELQKEKSSGTFKNKDGWNSK